MTFAVNVKGGTGAGSKRPLKERRWMHGCSPNLGGGCFPETATVFGSDADRGTIQAARDRGECVVVLPSITYRSLTAYSCPHCGTRRPTTTEDK